MAEPPAAAAAQGVADVSAAMAGFAGAGRGVPGSGAVMARTRAASTVAAGIGSTALVVSGAAAGGGSMRGRGAATDASGAEAAADDAGRDGLAGDWDGARLDAGTGRAAGMSAVNRAAAVGGADGVANAIATTVSPPTPIDITARRVTIAAARLRDHAGAIDFRGVTIWQTRARRQEAVSAAGAIRMTRGRPRSVASLSRQAA